MCPPLAPGPARTGKGQFPATSGTPPVFCSGTNASPSHLGDPPGFLLRYQRVPAELSLEEITFSSVL